jgi:hypothetical protein
MNPRLLCSPLTGQVYIITRYTEKPHPTKAGRTILVSHRKYDVTEDFDAAVVDSRRVKRREKRSRLRFRDSGADHAR